MNRKLIQAMSYTALLLSSSVFAAAPTISSASLQNGTLSINGSNFGTKTQAAPYRYYPLKSNTDGQTGRQVGLEQYNSDEPEFTVTSNEMFAGSKSFVRFAAGSTADTYAGFFPHLGVIMPNGNNEIFASFWMKLHHTGTAWTNGSVQLKMARAGRKVSDTDGVANYGYTGAKILPSFYIHPDGSWISPQTGTNQDPAGNAAYISDQWNNDNGAGFENGSTKYPPNSSFNMFDNWVSVQVYYKFNDVGSANGIMRVYMYGNLVMEQTNIQPRTGTGQYLDHIQIFPGLAFMYGRDWYAYVTRIYVDTTQSHVFLGNAATLSAVTGRFTLPASAWSASGTTATDAATIPAGYNWLYVANSNGEINSAGFAYSSNGAVTAPPTAPALTVSPK